jgi:hypothetical protein
MPAGMTDDEEEIPLYGQYCGPEYAHRFAILDFFDSLCLVNALTSVCCSWCGNEKKAEGPTCNFNAPTKDGVDRCCRLHDA